MGGRKGYDKPLFSRVFACGDADGADMVDGEGEVGKMGMCGRSERTARWGTDNTFGGWV